MTRDQLQLEVCKAMMNKAVSLYGCDINENEFAVTTDGIKCFVFFDGEIIFDKSKIARRDFSKLFEEKETDIELKPTNKMLISNGKTVLQYICEDSNVFVAAKNAKPFEKFKFYASNVPLSRIIVKDDFGRLIGALMPVRVKESDL